MRVRAFHSVVLLLFLSLGLMMMGGVFMVMSRLFLHFLLSFLPFFLILVFLIFIIYLVPVLSVGVGFVFFLLLLHRLLLGRMRLLVVMLGGRC